MANPNYVLDVTQAVFRWASDPQHGPLVPSGFQNPFAERRRTTDQPAEDLFGEPDITIDMAAEFLKACDAWQLPLFSLHIFYGLRASEPCWLFQESLDDDWLKVVCDSRLGYTTKGRRDKRLPLIGPITRLLKNQQHQSQGGLLFQRRTVSEGVEQTPLMGTARENLRQEYATRLDRERGLSAKIRHAIRDQILQEAGGLTYDHIEHEFGRIKEKLAWPTEATLKDFRHLFSTCLQNAGMPEFYRKFLMGQSPGRAAIVGYTHLNQLRERYLETVERQLQPLVNGLEKRVEQLSETE